MRPLAGAFKLTWLSSADQNTQCSSHLTCRFVLQGVLVTSAAYGSFMSWNSNLRYQVIAGIIEERGIERLFAGNQALCGALSLAVRTGNTFLGSCMWVDYLRFLGLQKAPAAEA